MEDTASFGGFALYVGALGISGLLMLVLAVVSSTGRAINAILGLLAGGYAGFLLFSFFTKEAFEYRQFIFAYILPFIAIFQLYKAIKGRGQQPAEPAPSPEG